MEKIKDGNTEFRVIGKRLFSMLDLLYPVGRIIISNDSTTPYSDIGFGTWEEVSKGRVLWGADDSHAAGSTIEAGLPNITGDAGGCEWTEKSSDWDGTQHGAFYITRDGGQGETNGEVAYPISWENSQKGIRRRNINFNASRCSSVYGNSTTVTPPSYVVHFWQRTA